MQQLPKIYQYTYSTINSGVNSNYANKTAIKEVYEVVTYGDGTGSDKKQTYNVGLLTGLTGTSSDGVFIVQYVNDKKTAWTSIDGLKITGDQTKIYQSLCADRLKDLINDNITVFQDLLLSAEFVARLERKGYNCATYRQEIKSLYARLEERQNAIVAYSDPDSVKTATPQLLSNALQKIISGESIGIAVTTAVIITAVAVASFSALAWFVWYSYGVEGRSDCRKSKELNKILANVDPDVKEQLYNYIDNYADSFYKKAVARTKTAGLLSNIKTVALIGLGGFFVYNFFKKE